MRTYLLLTLFFLACLVPGLKAAENYHELRVYEVSSNKLDAVLERFRETVEPLRQKHGITTRGYWTATTTNGQKFIYLLAAADRAELQASEKEFGADPDFKKGYGESTAKYGKTVEKITSIPLVSDPSQTFRFEQGKESRVYELRIYTIMTGKMDLFEKRWRENAVPIYERHGLHSIAWWRTSEKAGEGSIDQFICLMAGKSEQEIQKTIAAFHQDPEWQKVERETEKDGKLRSSVEAYKLRPTPFSKLQ